MSKGKHAGRLADVPVQNPCNEIPLGIPKFPILDTRSASTHFPRNPVVKVLDICDGVYYVVKRVGLGGFHGPLYRAKLYKWQTKIGVLGATHREIDDRID